MSSVPVPSQSWVTCCGPVRCKGRDCLCAPISLQPAEVRCGHGPGQQQLQRVFIPECPVGRVGFHEMDHYGIVAFLPIPGWISSQFFLLQAALFAQAWD